jgi:predicted RND superfamily exporter protein
MPLDTRGKIAAAEIAFYVPIVILTMLLVFRYAFRRDAGWFFLLIFSMCESTILDKNILQAIDA